MSKGQQCAVDGCPNEAPKCRSLCWMHLKRPYRGTPRDAPRQERLGAKERLRVAALNYANAESDEEYERAWCLLLKYARKLGMQKEAP